MLKNIFDLNKTSYLFRLILFSVFKKKFAIENEQLKKLGDSKICKRS